MSIMTIPTTRLTWTSWLWYYYPQWRAIIHATMGLGIYRKISYKRFDKIYYKFTETDKQEMKDYVDEWI